MNAGKLFQPSPFSSNRRKLSVLVSAVFIAISALYFSVLPDDPMSSVEPPILAGPEDSLGDG